MPWTLRVVRRVLADTGDRAAGLLARRVETHVAEHQESEQRDPLGVRRAGVPQPIVPPEAEEARAPAFGGHAGTLRGDLVGRSLGQVAQRLPADRRVGTQQPVERVH